MDGFGELLVKQFILGTLPLYLLCQFHQPHPLRHHYALLQWFEVPADVPFSRNMPVECPG